MECLLVTTCLISLRFGNLLGDILDNSDHPITGETVAAAFTNAYKEQLKLKAEIEVLGTLGYTLEDFKAKGLGQLGADTFGRLFYEIQQLTIDLTFSVGGGFLGGVASEMNTSNVLGNCVGAGQTGDFGGNQGPVDSPPTDVPAVKKPVRHRF